MYILSTVQKCPILHGKHCIICQYTYTVNSAIIKAQRTKHHTAGGNTMKEIRTKVCKKANAYIKSGMNRSAAFKRAWSETYVKAANLQNGDKIMVTTYSNLWREMVTAPATVICVNMFGKNVNIMVKAVDGMKEFFTDAFMPAAQMVEIV